MHPVRQRFAFGVTIEVWATAEEIAGAFGDLTVEAATVLTGHPPTNTYQEMRLNEMMGLDLEQMVAFSPVIHGMTVEFFSSVPLCCARGLKA